MRRRISIALTLLLLLAAVAWWYWRAAPTPRAPAPPPDKPFATHGQASNPGTFPPCPLPPTLATEAMPLQSPVPPHFPELTRAGAQIHTLAGFSVDARVLSRRDYADDREADYSPTDLALGWGPMSNSAVLQRLQIRQQDRWYHYSWKASPPIPSRTIARNSANMHIIPANQAVASALRRVQAGQRVRIDGWLVEVAAPDGWRWRSSLTRDDMGQGACELIYTCAISTH